MMMGECGSGSCSLHERKEAGSEEGIRNKVCAQRYGSWDFLSPSFKFSTISQENATSQEPNFQ